MWPRSLRWPVASFPAWLVTGARYVRARYADTVISVDCRPFLASAGAKCLACPCVPCSYGHTGVLASAPGERWRYVPDMAARAALLWTHRSSVTSGCRELVVNARYAPNPSCLAVISMFRRRLLQRADGEFSICPHAVCGRGHIGRLPPITWRWGCDMAATGIMFGHTGVLSSARSGMRVVGARSDRAQAPWPRSGTSRSPRETISAGAFSRATKSYKILQNPTKSYKEL